MLKEDGEKEEEGEEVEVIGPPNMELTLDMIIGVLITFHQALDKLN